MNPLTSVASRENFISAQINRIESATKRINGGINELEEKLAVVLRYSDPLDTKEGVPKERMPELAEVLCDRANELLDASNRLELILQRIELPGATKPCNPPTLSDGIGARIGGYPTMIKR